MKKNERPCKGVYIYGLIDPRTDEIRYVGQTTNTKRRLQQHIGLADMSMASKKVAWLKEIAALQLRPTLRVFQCVQSWDLADKMESEWTEKILADGHRLLNSVAQMCSGPKPRISKTYADDMPPWAGAKK